MEDVLTEIPPPSRFFQEELNNFTPPSPPLSSPFLLFSDPCYNEPLLFPDRYDDKSLRPSLLIISISSPSLNLFHNVSSKTLIGSLVLPEIPFSGSSIEPSLSNKSCNIYELKHSDNSVLLVSVQYVVPVERSYAVAKLLIGEKIIPERVLILDSVQSRNFRGKLPPDETFALKMETSLERKGDGSKGSSLLKGLDYFPSGSVLDGLAAALLSQCQIRNIKGTLCVSWPEFGSSVTSMIKSLLIEHVLPDLEVGSNADTKNDQMIFSRSNDNPFDSELYT